MSRSVADRVLVRDDFGVLPGMVAEERQILRNIQRVARLFITWFVSHGARADVYDAIRCQPCTRTADRPASPRSWV